MTFGKIKSVIERNLIESYIDSNDFKKKIREFKENVLRDKNISKIYSIYDQLSTPQGLNENDAKEFLEEGLEILRRLLPNVKLPKNISEDIKNTYEDIDILVYELKPNLIERIQCRKNIVKILTSSKQSIKENINIPIRSMVNIANQTLKSYVDSLDENTKKELFNLLTEDCAVLETKFDEMKNEAISKLENILKEEKESDIKEKITETIDKIKNEKFDQINFLKIRNLVSSI